MLRKQKKKWFYSDRKKSLIKSRIYIAGFFFTDIVYCSRDYNIKYYKTKTGPTVQQIRPPGVILFVRQNIPRIDGLYVKLLFRFSKRLAAWTN